MTAFLGGLFVCRFDSGVFAMYINRKGIQFSYTDTYDIHEVLRPIIASALKKFIEVRELKKDWCGTPGIFMLEAAETGLTEEEAHQEWDNTLQFIYEAFSEEEPNIDKYDFKQSIVSGKPREDGLIPAEIVLEYGEEERDRYRKDEAAYLEKRQKGYELFGKYLQNLWW